VYPESKAKSPSRYVLVTLRMTVARTRRGLIWTYSGGRQRHHQHTFSVDNEDEVYGTYAEYLVSS